MLSNVEISSLERGEEGFGYFAELQKDWSDWIASPKVIEVGYSIFSK